ncbi:MAG: hypothetical protein M3014_03060, partial [Chloroflexota bacterium]|nr:hypothetical protein [Chloroflexota bacterium]
RDHVATVGTHITFRLRSAWREMAKALGVSPGRTSYVASRLPELVGVAMLEDGEEESTEREEIDHTHTGGEQPPRLADETERRAYSLAKSIEGLPRHAGMHCGGVVIAPCPIADVAPLQRAARDPTMAITQYDKDDVERMGLVKMDLLGSRALTSLVDALRSSGMAVGRGKVAPALDAIPFDDAQTYRLMAEGATLGCFQLESPGMRGLLKWLRPASLDDVAVAISLFRPGPLEGGFLEMFMRRHLGQDPVQYSHPAMEPILSDTHGVILYQEQFLRLAHELAGLDLGEAEKLRKSLGKVTGPEERAQLGSRFVAGAIEKGIDQMQAEKVWAIIAGYTGFGFCKAHACSYALTAYRSAYMKAHYPAHYLAAVINNMGGFYGPSTYVEEARRLGIALLTPNINWSGAWCEALTDKRAIRFGLQFIRGLHERTINTILSERRSVGRFCSLAELATRVEMPPNEMLSLIKVGACDDLSEDAGIPSLSPKMGDFGETLGSMYETPLNRKQMVLALPYFLYNRKSKDRRLDLISLQEKATGTEGTAGVQMLMGDFMHDGRGNTGRDGGSPRILGRWQSHIQVPDAEDYTPTEKLRLEQSILGFSLSLNEMELHREEMERKNVVPCGELARHAGRELTIAGVVAAGRRHVGKDGEWMLFLTVQDSMGLIEVVLFPDAYKAYGKILANGGCGPYLIKGQVQVSGKGRGIGIQPPANLRPTDVVSMKMHPVVIASEVSPL